MIDYTQIKQVESTSDAGEVNRMLEAGWVLLAVNQRMEDNNAWSEYVLAKKDDSITK